MIKVYKKGTFIEKGVEKTYGKLYKTFENMELKNLEDIQQILIFLTEEKQIQKIDDMWSECQVSELLRRNGFILQSY